MKELRKRAGLKAEEVAVKLGVSRSTVGNWEQGKAIPHFLMVSGLLKLYKCSFKQLDEAVRETQQLTDA